MFFVELNSVKVAQPFQQLEGVEPSYENKADIDYLAKINELKYLSYEQKYNLFLTPE